MDEHRMSTEKKRTDSGVTNWGRTRNTKQSGMELTNNEYETEAHQTMQFLNKYI